MKELIAQKADDPPEYYKDISKIPCPNCNGEMTMGEEECSGVCSKCYFDDNE